MDGLQFRHGVKRKTATWSTRKAKIVILMSCVQNREDVTEAKGERCLNTRTLSALQPVALLHAFASLCSRPASYAILSRPNCKQRNEIEHSLADEQDVHGTQIEFVEIWQGSEAIVSRMLSSIQLDHLISL